LGAPGSGKGTQANLLMKNFNYLLCSTGDLIRSLVSSGTELGIELSNIISSGGLVNDDLMIKIVSGIVNKSNTDYLLDGFPRSLKQAEYIISNEYFARNFVVINLHLDKEKLLSRVVNRRVSSDGLHIYNLLTAPPKIAGICDYSGLPLIQRRDDSQEVFGNRLDIYMRQTEPLLNFFNERKKLFIIDAEKDPFQVYNDIISIIQMS
jgi:adenylate kinase